MFLFVYDLTGWVSAYSIQLAIIPALIGAGAAIVGGLLSRSGAKKANEQNYDFQREMWNKQVAQQDKVNAQQMAYQDKVNAENREWSTESNVRQRIEDAGYNPYLYNGQASANSTGMASSTNLGNSITPGSVTAVNEEEGLSNSLNSVGSIMAQGAKTAQDAYTLSRGKAIDKQNDKVSGIKGGTESAQAQATLQASQNEARIKASTAILQDMEVAILQTQAMDKNGQPMVDESTGRPVTLAMQRERGQQQEVMYRVEKLKSDILNGEVDWENTSVDTLLKRYQLEKTNPEQLAILRQTFSNLKDTNLQIKAETKVLSTQVGLNNSQTRLNIQNVATQKRYAKLLGQQTLTEEEKTLFQKLQNHYGSAEKVAEIVQKARPHNFIEFANYLIDTWHDDLTGRRTSYGKIAIDVDSIANNWKNRRKGMAFKK